MPAADTEFDLIPITDEQLAARRARPVEGETVAHFQIIESKRKELEVYWVERLDISGWRSGHLVEVLWHGEEIFAACDDSCEWWPYRTKKTVCRHILAAVEMAIKRREARRR